MKSNRIVTSSDFARIMFGVFVPVLAVVFVMSDIDRGTQGVYGLLILFGFEFAFLKISEPVLRPTVENLTPLYGGLTFLLCVVLWFYFDAPSGMAIHRLESILAILSLAGITLVNTFICIRCVLSIRTRDRQG